MTELLRCETLVLGGDLEALVAALWLARRGRRVALLCERPRLGGLHAGVEVAPDAQSAGTAHDEERFPTALAGELDLAAHGLAFVPAAELVAVSRDGRVRRVARGSDDPWAALPASETADGRALDATLAPHRALLAEQLVAAPPDLDPPDLAGIARLSGRAARWRGLGAASLHELCWRLPTSVSDWLEPTIADPLLRAALAADALPGTWVGPRAAGTSAVWLLRDAARGVPARRPAGGSSALVAALVRALREHGVYVRCGEPVVRLATSGRGERARVRGAWLADGHEFRADAVLSTLGARRTLEALAPDDALDADAREALAPLRARGTIAVLDLVLDHEPPLEPLGGAPFEHLRVLDDEDALERCADAVKHGELAERPWLEVFAARPPTGRAVWTVHVHGVPTAPVGGWDDARRETLRERALSTLSELAPELRDRLVGARLRTPSDLAAAHGLEGGHLWQAELALDQLLLLRPTAELARYAAPLEGLYLGGTAQHPGGIAPGLAGRLAAERLADEV